MRLPKYRALGIVKLYKRGSLKGEPLFIYSICFYILLVNAVYRICF